MRRLAALVAPTVFLGACSVPTKVVADAPVEDATLDVDSDLEVDAARAAVIEAHCDGLAGEPRLLVYGHANGYMHPAIPDAKAALLLLCNEYGFTVTVTDDPLALDDARLAETDVLVLALTSGTAFEPAQRVSVENWVHAGGGIVGLHTATSHDQDWPFFTQIMGAKFKGHPPGVWRGRLDVVAPSHPIVAPMAMHWTRIDEWYTFDARPELNAGMTMLLAIDESSLPNDYAPEFLVGYHPLVWAHELAGGRVVQSAIGHTPESYQDAAFMAFVVRTIRWAAHQL
jgi:uncharacterized protein